ncbi:MAG: Holliday junction resolvase RuvX [Rickettsiales bacterium]|jgi:putative Holliday junction resolvase|nr:Holliday junction resolvase RuvX [Rickettsiales bacterium]
MILANFKDFPRIGRILGVDWGQCRVGLAVSDETQEFFFIRPQIENRPWSRAAVASVAAVAEEENAAGIVIGLPLRFDGSESPTTQAVRRFAKDLDSYIDLPIIFVDELLTSIEAEESLAGASRAEMKKKLDSESAKIILDNALAMVKRCAQ